AQGRTLHPVPQVRTPGRPAAWCLHIVAADDKITAGDDHMSRAAAASGQRDPFEVGEEAALAQLERSWSGARYHALRAGGGLWYAVSSAGEVLTGDTPDALDRAIRAHWQALRG